MSSRFIGQRRKLQNARNTLSWCEMWKLVISKSLRGEMVLVFFFFFDFLTKENSIVKAVVAMDRHFVFVSKKDAHICPYEVSSSLPFPPFIARNWSSQGYRMLLWRAPKSSRELWAPIAKRWYPLSSLPFSHHFRLFIIATPIHSRLSFQDDRFVLVSPLAMQLWNLRTGDCLISFSKIDTHSYSHCEFDFDRVLDSLPDLHPPLIDRLSWSMTRSESLRSETPPLHPKCSPSNHWILFLVFPLRAIL